MTGGHWVFGYGSLMWRPGFAFLERQAATLHGRRRACCIYSVHHRGTPERRGLVLGLAPGGATRCSAFLVADADWSETYAYLREREQPVPVPVENVSHVVSIGSGRLSSPVLLALGERGIPVQREPRCGASG